MTKWKSTTEEDRAEFVEWLKQWGTHRMERDHERYGDEYQGNPLETIVGELFDGIFGAWMLSRNGRIGEEVGPWDHPDSVQFYAHHRHSVEELYPSEKVFLEDAVMKADTMLDVGCASGGLYGAIREWNPEIAYNGMDISEASIAEAKPRYPKANFFIGSGTGIGHPNDDVNLVTCFNVAVHEPQTWLLLKECYRVAKHEVLFDVRLDDKRTQGELKIAFSGEDTGQRTPYVVNSHTDWWRMLNKLDPKPKRIEMAGYIHRVSHMAEGVPEEVFMAVFRIVKNDY